MIVVLVGLTTRVAVVAWAWGRVRPVGDARYYHELATRVAAGHGYTWLWPDGVVTAAAHYPVGYPGALAALYAVVGPSGEAGMLLNAALGSMAGLATHRLLRGFRSRPLALTGGLMVALHPALVSYTPALMTEGVTASLLVCGVWATARARSARGFRAWAWVALGIGGLLGLSTLVRPQSLLMAPLLGGLAAGRWRFRVVSFAALSAGVALLVCAPWTLRNCRQMGRCALVSVNVGWNLLIGTQPEGGGGWTEVRVPAGCQEVFDEAEKDRCFEQAALDRIRTAPGAWLGHVPDKLAATFDYGGAPGWYLNASAPEALGSRAKLALGVVETVYERVVLLLALVAAAAARGRAQGRTRRGLGFAFVAVGSVCALTLHAWIGVLALCLAILLRRRSLLRQPAVFGATAALLTATAVTHAVFFGAGRYGMVISPVLCALAAVGIGRARSCLVRRRAQRAIIRSSSRS